MIATHPAGRAALNRVSRERFRRHCRPLPRLTMSQWAERYRVLSPEATANHGPWRNDIAPYLVEIMDALSDRVTQEVTFVAPSQSGKSEVLLNAMGYFMHQEPSPMIVVQPTTETGEAFSKDRIAPMLRDAPALGKLVGAARSRDSNNTIASKALALDTPIPTPAGWTTMGDLGIGDAVYGADGLPCTVVAKSPVFVDHECFVVEFSDGQKIVADAGHLWAVEWWSVVTSKGEKAKQVRHSGVLTTAEMAPRVKQGNRYRFSVRNANPLVGPDLPLPVDPYVLGVWLGDGNSNNTRVTAHRDDVDEMIRHVEACGHATAKRLLRNDTFFFKIDPKTPTSNAGGTGRFVAPASGLQHELNRLGLIRKAGAGPSLKHIPPAYLRASFQQRVSLLQGLMDTDGTVTKNGASGLFVTVLPALAAGFSELLSSLGIKHTGRLRKCHATVNGQRRQGRDATQFLFALPTDFEVFRLERKAERQRTRLCAGIRANYRRIVSITHTESVPVQCIAVDNDSHLFLAGRSMVPTHNTYPGGQLDIVGSNAPSGLAMRPKRFVALDERDRHSANAGGEGDVKRIVYARTRSYQRRRKIYEVSSPTDDESSLIWPSYLEGTQEVFEVPCPACGVFQTLEFERLRWTLDSAGAVHPASVHYHCAACETPIPTTAKGRMLRGGRWRATAVPRVPHKRSFWLHGLCAAFALWEEVAQEFVSANSQSDPAKRAMQLRAFFNTTLGVLFKDQQQETQKTTLLARARRYDGGSGDDPVRFHVPREGAILTAGVDVQHDRFEVIVRAWGVGETSWLIERAILRGDTTQDSTWAALDDYLSARRWTHESGTAMTIRAATVDAGDGAMSKRVYQFCAPRLHRHVYAIKGSSNETAPLIPAKPTKVKPGRLYVCGVNAAMDVFNRRLNADTVGTGYLHLNDYASEDYVTQVLSMRRVINPKTRKRRWEATPGVRNEAADCEVYAYLALLLGPVPVASLAGEVAKLGEAVMKAPEPAPVKPAPVAKPASAWLPRRGKGWL